MSLITRLHVIIELSVLKFDSLRGYRYRMVPYNSKCLIGVVVLPSAHSQIVVAFGLQLLTLRHGCHETALFLSPMFGQVVSFHTVSQCELVKVPIPVLIVF